MKSKFASLVALIFHPFFHPFCLSFCLLFWLSSCTTGGITLPPGSICPTNFGVPNPANNTVTPVVSLVPPANKDAGVGNTSALQPGTYTYSSADIYFVDNVDTSGTPFEVQLHDGLTSSGTSSTGVACMANAKFKALKAYSINLSAVTDIAVDSNYQVAAYTRSYSFVTNPNSLTTAPFTFTVSPKSLTGVDAVDSALAITPTLVSSVAVMNPNNDFQLTAMYTDPNQGPNYTFSVVIHMVYNNAASAIPTSVQGNALNKGGLGTH